MAPHPHWLLLRGLVRERRHWGDFPAELAAHTGAEVLALDLPGVGTERDRPSPTRIPEIVDDLRARFAPVRGAGPWAIFAPSLDSAAVCAHAQARAQSLSMKAGVSPASSAPPAKLLIPVPCGVNQG